MTDAEIVAALAEARKAAAEVPERIREIGRSAYAWRTVDAELAALSADTDTPIGTRAEPAAVRALTFAARDLTIEVEITDDALHGQVVPPTPGEIELRDRTGVVAVAQVDELGWFVLGPVPRGMFRLHLRAGDAVVVTEWITI
ncbi:hypothetical protein Ais01nite_07610 [Asanoa ishikariensis]|uniref:Carboxypeptidase regulatory-like domain-containing protein n=1 Tax=Asanoa ishikariensis TaxID=137265 RepID=A0A1H3TD35_9ACTN|nr:hypothetical protein [Asanoa ishikariensis]GIF62726.1 hypothetical protein Ais01nite_07610 [Asanoa ishikariensis]SDZ47605.1 hypothetical protein SAMN05421684_5475 [Asanoa ishikariensis]